MADMRRIKMHFNLLIPSSFSFSFCIRFSFLFCPRRRFRISIAEIQRIAENKASDRILYSRDYTANLTNNVRRDLIDRDSRNTQSLFFFKSVLR